MNLGLAVDVERKDGSRGLVVPVIHEAERLSFREFHEVYEGLVEKARGNKLMPDAFAGATMSLTNPGGLGTSASVPRLMPGQGSIIAVGAIGYPTEYAGVAEEQLRSWSVGKVMTVSSTYDHRVIQGAESGEFLRTLDGLLQGEDRFYESVFESLGLTLPPLSRFGGDGGPAAARRQGRRPHRRIAAVPRRRGDGAGQGDPDPRPPGGPSRPAGQRAAGGSRARPGLRWG